MWCRGGVVVYVVVVCRGVVQCSGVGVYGCSDVLM